MAGIFGMFDVTKEGKGVKREENKYTGIALFFILLFRKFWNYIRISLLYFLTCLPSLVVFALVAMYLFSDYATSVNASAIMSLCVAMSAFIITFWVGSPFKAGFVYTLRNYVREKHAWIWSDFIKHTKLNLALSIKAWLVDVLFSLVILVNLRFYLINLGTSPMYTVFFVATLFVMWIYTIVQGYVWTMIVTFDLKLSEIYKNAMIFAFVGLVNNLKSTAIRLIVFWLLFFTKFNVYLALILHALIFLGASGLLEQVYSYPIVKKYMLDTADTPDSADND